MARQLTLSSEHALRLCEALLRDSNWRQRVVEQIRPVSSDHYRVARSYQFELTPDIVEKSGLTETDDVNGAIVPVGWFEKRPLLDLDICDQDGSSLTMLERQSIAGIVADVSWTWMAECNIPADAALSREELESINVASLATWMVHESMSQDRLTAANGYVYAGTGHRLSRDSLHECLREAQRLADLAERVLGSGLYATEATTANTALNTVVLAPYLYSIPETPEALHERMRSLQRRVEGLLEFASLGYSRGGG